MQTKCCDAKLHVSFCLKWNDPVSTIFAKRCSAVSLRGLSVVFACVLIKRKQIAYANVRARLKHTLYIHTRNIVNINSRLFTSSLLCVRMCHRLAYLPSVLAACTEPRRCDRPTHHIVFFFFFRWHRTCWMDGWCFLNEVEWIWCGYMIL